MSYTLFSVPYKRHVVFSLSICNVWFFCCHLQGVLLLYHMQCAVFPMHFSCYIHRMFFSSYHIHAMFFVFNVLYICNVRLQYVRSTYNSCCFFPYQRYALINSYSFPPLSKVCFYLTICKLRFFLSYTTLYVLFICVSSAK